MENRKKKVPAPFSFAPLYGKTGFATMPEIHGVSGASPRAPGLFQRTDERRCQSLLYLKAFQLFQHGLE